MNSPTKPRCVWTCEGIFDLRPAELAPGTSLHAAPAAPRKPTSNNGKKKNGNRPKEEYPNVAGVPIRGKRFTDPKERPQSATVSHPLPDKYEGILKEIEEWEIKHNPKPEPFKLDDLQSPDYYTKFYIDDLHGAARYNDIKPEQIKLAPLDADLWEKYRLIEGMYHIIQIEALKSGKRPTVFRSLSPFPFYHDSLIQLRSQIHKRTGLNYKTVERGLNHMLKKQIIRHLRESRAYILDIRCDWNRTNLWRMECEDIINAREKWDNKANPGRWMRREYWAWQEYGDFKWPHRNAYCKEHQTFI